MTCVGGLSDADLCLQVSPTISPPWLEKVPRHDKEGQSGHEPVHARHQDVVVVWHCTDSILHGLERRHDALARIRAHRHAVWLESEIHKEWEIWSSMLEL